MRIPTFFSNGQALEGLIAVGIMDDIADEMTDDEWLDAILSEPTDGELEEAEWANLPTRVEWMQ
jgi:hypothetical protein